MIDKTNGWAYGAIGMTVLFWGSAGVVGRFIGTDYSAAELAIIRNGWAILTLLVILLPGLRIKSKAGFTFNARVVSGYAAAALAGCTGYGLMQWLFFASARLTYASHLVLILALAPIGTQLMLLAFERVRPTRNEVIGSLIGFGGVLIMVGVPAQSGPKDVWLGDLLALAAMLSFSAYTVLMRRVGNSVAAVPANLTGMAAGLILLLACFKLAQPTIPMELPQGTNALGLLYLGICSTGLAYWLYTRSIKELGIGKVMPFLYLQPVVGTMLSALWLGEPITAAFAIGTICVVGGLIMMNKKERKPVCA